MSPMFRQLRSALEQEPEHPLLQRYDEMLAREAVMLEAGLPPLAQVATLLVNTLIAKLFVDDGIASDEQGEINKCLARVAVALIAWAGGPDEVNKINAACERASKMTAEALKRMQEDASE